MSTLPEAANSREGSRPAGSGELGVSGLASGCHMMPGTPKKGRSYFFSVGDFGVAACERAYKARTWRSERY